MSPNFSDTRVIEVIVTSVQDAIAAEAGGADRLELIRDFAVGGLTPEIAVIEEVLSAVSIPVRVMVRENAGFTVTDRQELDAVLDHAVEVSSLPIDGLVFGYVRDGLIDEVALSALLERVPSANVTFHRAFEATNNHFASINTLKRYPRVDRILTNGGSFRSWAERVRYLCKLQEAAHPILLLVGGEVDVDAARELAATELHEFHIGRAGRRGLVVEGAVDMEKIFELRGIFDKPS